MMRAACVFTAAVVFAGLAFGQQVQNQANNKMVKGTVKSIDADTGVLIVNQELKNNGQTQVVDRELSIKPTTQFIINGGAAKQEAEGKEGLKLLQRLEGVVGAKVQVKCDKDVTPTTVTITLKK